MTRLYEEDTAQLLPPMYFNCEPEVIENIYIQGRSNSSLTAFYAKNKILKLYAQSDLVSC